MNRDYIPLSVPFLNGNELNYVKDCIDTEWVSSAGGYVNLFEDKIAKYKQPKKIIFMDNLPRNSMGKVQKNLLRKNNQNLFNVC